MTPLLTCTSVLSRTSLRTWSLHVPNLVTNTHLPTAGISMASRHATMHMKSRQFYKRNHYPILPHPIPELPRSLAPESTRVPVYFPHLAQSPVSHSAPQTQGAHSSETSPTVLLSCKMSQTTSPHTTLIQSPVQETPRPLPHHAVLLADPFSPQLIYQPE